MKKKKINYCRVSIYSLVIKFYSNFYFESANVFFLFFLFALVRSLSLSDLDSLLIHHGTYNFAIFALKIPSFPSLSCLQILSKFLQHE